MFEMKYNVTINFQDIAERRLVFAAMYVYTVKKMPVYRHSRRGPDVLITAINGGSRANYEVQNIICLKTRIGAIEIENLKRRASVPAPMAILR